MKGSGLFKRIRPPKGSSVEGLTEVSQLGRSLDDGQPLRNQSTNLVSCSLTLQLLHFVAAFLQERDHALRPGEMQCAGDNQRRLPGLDSGFDPGGPFCIAAIQQTPPNCRCFFHLPNMHRIQPVSVARLPCFDVLSVLQRSIRRVNESLQQVHFAFDFVHV